LRDIALQSRMGFLVHPVDRLLGKADTYSAVNSSIFGSCVDGVAVRSGPRGRGVPWQYSTADDGTALVLQRHFGYGTNGQYICLATIHTLLIHLESKKQDTKLLAITSLNIIRFSKFFTSRLGSKFATNSCLNIPPRFKHVATLPCEIWMQKNGIILKYILQLMMNHKIV